MHRSLLWITGLMMAMLGMTSPATAGEGLRRLAVIDQKVGTGPVARPGMQVELNYTGWLYDAGSADHHGAEVDSSRQHGQTITFILGTGQVIAGWDKGIRGMHVGGRRTLLIPPHLGYGSRGAGRAIPPDASLVFDIELVSAH